MNRGRSKEELFEEILDDVDELAKLVEDRKNKIKARLVRVRKEKKEKELKIVERALDGVRIQDGFNIIEISLKQNRGKVLKELEEKMILLSYKECKQNKAEAARVLGISSRSYEMKLKKALEKQGSINGFTE